MLGKLRVLGVGLLLVIALALTPFRPLKITGHSMEPTLRDGETYLLDQMYWKLGGLRRDDIVVIDRGEEKWVKRLIGMPNDRLLITYRPDGWIVKVENLTVDPSLRGTRPDPGLQAEERAVQPNEIFVIGDNLNWSADSTNQEVAAFRREDVIGVVRTFTMQRRFPFRRHL